MSRLIRLGVFKNILLIRMDHKKLVTKEAKQEKIKKLLINIIIRL